MRADRVVYSPLLAAALAGLLATGAFASNHLPEPSWADGAMFLSHEFPANDPNPAPTEFVHPEGADMMLSEVYIGSGAHSNSWQDPNVYPDSLTREDSGGAWSLGAGTLSNDGGRIEVPFRLNEIETSGDFSGFDVELFVNVVWYQNIGGAPSISVMNSTPTNTQSSSGFFDSRAGKNYTDNWHLTTWSGRATNIMEEAMTLVVNGNTSGSVVDTVQVWASPTAIPEPRVYAAMFGVAALGAALWRRRTGRKTM